METDKALHVDPAFAPHFARYAGNQREFFDDFAKAFAKLSECGAKFSPPHGIKI